ncbi:MAG: HIT family protein [Bacillales bacterium]|nr:HIT family protein [Bacillales bacterium]
MDNCIFCKIVKGEIPCYKVYEDKDVLAFLDISQTTVGHTLVIPKEHFDNLLFCPRDLLEKVMHVAQSIAQAQVSSLGAKGVNVLINTNEVAGQTVMHFHVHVIPRYSNEDALRLEFLSNKIDKLNLPAIAENISNKL